MIHLVVLEVIFVDFIVFVELTTSVSVFDRDFIRVNGLVGKIEPSEVERKWENLKHEYKVSSNWPSCNYKFC